MFRIPGIVAFNLAAASERGPISEGKKQKLPKACGKTPHASPPPLVQVDASARQKTNRNADDLH